MTTGNLISDTRVNTSTSCGTAKIGSYRRRAWSGADGRSKENPFSSTTTVWYEPLIKWSNAGSTAQNTGAMTTCFGGSFYTDPPQASIDLLRTRVLKGVLGKYKQHDFNAAVFLGELPESVGMVAGSCTNVLRAYRYARKGKFSKALKVLRDANGERSFRVDRHAANSWLALRYGWIPLLSDAYSAADAYQTLSTKKPDRYVRVRSKASIPMPTSSQFVMSTDYGKYSRSIVLKTRVKLSTAKSLGFLDPTLLAWELLPFSFVLDWVYDVGSWLDLVTSLPSGYEYTYIETAFARWEVRGPVKKFKNYQYNVRSGSDLFVKREYRVTRTVSNNPSVPPPRLKNPFNGTMKRFGDMLALARALT